MRKKLLSILALVLLALFVTAADCKKSNQRESTSPNTETTKTAQQADESKSDDDQKADEPAPADEEAEATDKEEPAEASDEDEADEDNTAAEDYADDSAANPVEQFKSTADKKIGAIEAEIDDYQSKVDGYGDKVDPMLLDMFAEQKKQKKKVEDQIEALEASADPSNEKLDKLRKRLGRLEDQWKGMKEDLESNFRDIEGEKRAQ